MKTIEIVTHCWSGPKGQYARLLLYQMHSLIDSPPDRCRILLSVLATGEDSAMQMIPDNLPARCEFPRTVEFRFLVLPKPYLLQRPYGRNRAALESKADIVWWADCDYLWGPGCLDTLAQLDLSQHKLFFPRTTLICRDHATGDRYIKREVGAIDPADFIPKTEHKAIGGIQIVTGETARIAGYVPHIKRYQQPAPEGTNTIVGFGADRQYRIQLGTPGHPIDLPNLFRLRHSETGDNRAKAKHHAQ